MKPFVRDTLMRQRARLHELDALLAAPDVVDNMDRFRALTREHAEASTITEVFNRYLQREEDMATATEMLQEPDLAGMAQDEIDQAKGDLEALDTELQQTQTTNATPSWRYGQAPGAMSRPCSPAIWPA